jgi:hypothetical protein
MQFKHVYIPYKALQDCDYMQKQFIKQLFYAKIQGLNKPYYSLLDLKKVVISA